MAFNKEWMDELKQKCDIGSIVSRYVPLERKGRLLWGRCPFHSEKTPSFAVNEYDGFYHCFGCHAGGDVVKFVQEIESVGFGEAIKILADIAHMEVPSDGNNDFDGEAIRKRKEKETRLKALLKDAAVYYHSNLNKKECTKQRQYFENRNITPALISRFGLGASMGFSEIVDFLKSKGYTQAEMLESGVCKEKNGRLYDALGGRVIFPIINTYSEVVAFTGRSLEKKPNFAKYINTQETPVFSKSKNLYAINLVKKQKQSSPIDYIIVVEGHIDVVSLHKAGFTTAVASMGTALTVDQAKLIKRFTNKVFICYDGDSAGQHATMRGLDILKENGLDVFIVALPDPLDPDDVINKYGAEGYQKLLDEAMPLLEFKLKYLSKEFDKENLDGKTKFALAALDALKKASEVEREMYLPLVSQESGLNIDFIRRMSEGGENTAVESEAKKYIEPNTSYKRETSPSDSKFIVAEKQVLSSIVQKRNYAYPKSNYSYLFSDSRKDMFEFLFENRDKEQNELKESFYDAFAGHSDSESDDASEIITFTLKGGSEEKENQYYKDCLWLLYKRYLEAEKEKLSEEMAKEVETDKRREYMVKINEINQKIQSKKVEL